MATILDRLSKADTRALLLRDGGGAADLAVDQSQWRTDLTNNTTYLTSTDTRLAVVAPREIAVVVKLATGNSGIVLNWGNVAGTTYIYRITISAGSVQFGHNNALLTSLTPPNVGAIYRLYAIHWSTDYDYVEVTYYSEMAVCDLTTGTWSITRITHSSPNAPAGGDQFNVIGRGAGSSPFTGGIGVVDYVRVGCRFHSTTEAKEDWYAESSAPSVDGVQLPIQLAPASTSYYTENPANDISDAILDAGTFAGPAEFAATINAAATADGYTDQHMFLDERRIGFGTSAVTADGYVIRHIDESREGAKTLFVVSYQGEDQTKYQLAFFYEPASGGRIIYKNQDHLVWTRKVATS